MARETRTSLACLFVGLALVGCGEPRHPGDTPDPGQPPVPSATPSTAAPTALFADRAREWGLSFHHQQGTLLWYLPQVTGSGVALFDYDGDGGLDAYLVQGTGPEDGTCPATVPPSHLYRHAGARFEECAAAAGAAERGFGMAALAADLDNDGYADLTLTRYGEPNRHLRNNGDGTFSERAGAAGLQGKDLIWASSLTALDYDRDGFLDVYQGQYLRFPRAAWTRSPPFRPDPGGMGPVTLMPADYPPLPNTMFRNRADGTFEDTTARTELADEQGQTMGALAMDFDGDGWPDLMVANDGGTLKRFFHNEGNGLFRDVGRDSMLAERRGAMGFAVGDYDQDGTHDVVVTHFDLPAALYRAVSRKGPKGRRFFFVDRAAQVGIVTGKPKVGWAAAFMDIGNDGTLDLLEITGRPNPPEGDPLGGTMAAEVAQLYMNKGKGVLEPSGVGPGDPLARARVGRGAGFGDLDRDGTVDLVLNNNNQAAELLMQNPAPGAWIGLWPVGTASNRDAVGASLELEQAGSRRIRQVTSGESYFSSNARHVLVGLGARGEPVTVRVRWPSGLAEEFGGLAVRRYHPLVEGAGRSVRGVF